jgi:cysteine desulfurase
MKQPQTIYLDNAAATPMDKTVFEAMQPYMTDAYFNPSAQYTAAREVKQQLEAARARVAFWFGSRPSEVIFTAGGTEANNLAIQGVLRQYPDAYVITSAIEHESVLEPAARYNHRTAPVQPDGQLDIEACLDLVDDQTVLISVQYANNETGVVQPIRRLTQAVAEMRKARIKSGNELPLLVHTDACQAPAYLDIHAARLGVDFMTINSGKIYGPRQTGALYVKLVRS